jgi:hypothetical protein
MLFANRKAVRLLPWEIAASWKIVLHIDIQSM